MMLSDISMPYCPHCGKKTLSFPKEKHWTCPTCGFDLYKNTAAATGLIIEVAEKILMIVRKKEPQKGKLALPGGFVDQGETLEQGCIRECAEEIGLIPEHILYICSASNIYPYKNIIYHTCDVFFAASFPNETTDSLLKKIHTQESEIADVCFVSIQSQADINALPLAFDSARTALSKWLAAKTPGNFQNE